VDEQEAMRALATAHDSQGALQLIKKEVVDESRQMLEQLLEDLEGQRGCFPFLSWWRSSMKAQVASLEERVKCVERQQGEFRKTVAAVQTLEKDVETGKHDLQDIGSKTQHLECSQRDFRKELNQLCWEVGKHQRRVKTPELELQDISKLADELRASGNEMPGKAGEPLQDLVSGVARTCTSRPNFEGADRKEVHNQATCSLSDTSTDPSEAPEVELLDAKQNKKNKIARSPSPPQRSDKLQVSAARAPAEPPTKVVTVEAATTVLTSTPKADEEALPAVAAASAVDTPATAAASKTTATATAAVSAAAAATPIPTTAAAAAAGQAAAIAAPTTLKRRNSHISSSFSFEDEDCFAAPRSSTFQTAAARALCKETLDYLREAFEKPGSSRESRKEALQHAKRNLHPDKATAEEEKEARNEVMQWFNNAWRPLNEAWFLKGF